jgi:hypothetical protein
MKASETKMKTEAGPGERRMKATRKVAKRKYATKRTKMKVKQTIVKSRRKAKAKRMRTRKGACSSQITIASPLSQNRLLGRGRPQLGPPAHQTPLPSLCWY